MFWRNNERARNFLQEWWDYDCLFEWNRDHPYEQESLHELIEARKYDVDASLVQVLDISAFPSTENTKSTQFILHIDESYELEKALGLEDGNIMGYRSRL